MSQQKPRSELYLRLLSALVLISIALGATYSGILPFAILILLGVVLMCREWSRLIFGRDVLPALALQGLTCVGAIFLFLSGFYGPALGLVTVGAVLSGLLGLFRSERTARSLWLGVGVFYITLPALSLLWFRQDPSYGFQAVLYLFLIVWGTDSAAYFTGRSLGGPKLWARVSPKKTWSGFLGGLSASALVGLGFSLYLQIPHMFFFIGQSVALAAFSQLGDLAESALKRHFEIKDTGTLIPGHGGILDRVDGLVFAACAASVIAFVFNSLAPGKALFSGL